MSYDNTRATAPPEPTPDQLAEALEQRVLPVMPDNLSDHERRLIRPPPRNPLADSYRTQRYTFEDGNGRYVLTPGPAGLESSPRRPTAQLPIELPVHFISSWHRDGAPSTFAECLAAHNELAARLRALKSAFRLASAVAEDLTWFESFAMVSALDDDQLLEMARQAGQPAVIRWDAAGLSVLPTGLGSDIPASTTAWRLESTEVATCPVRKDADPAGRCTRYGGPWGGSAIHAAALWRAHRTVAITLLGCGPCGRGQDPIWGPPRTGSPISLAEEVIGSRYGGYTWHRPDRHG